MSVCIRYLLIKTYLVEKGVACVVALGDIFVVRDVFLLMWNEVIPPFLFLCDVLHFTGDADFTPAPTPSVRSHFRLFDPLFLETFYLL